MGSVPIFDLSEPPARRPGVQCLSGERAPERSAGGLLADLDCAFGAVREQRQAIPSFYDGLQAQTVADSVLESHAHHTWIDIPSEPR